MCIDDGRRLSSLRKGWYLLLGDLVPCVVFISPSIDQLRLDWTRSVLSGPRFSLPVTVPWFWRKKPMRQQQRGGKSRPTAAHSRRRESKIKIKNSQEKAANKKNAAVAAAKVAPAVAAAAAAPPPRQLPSSAYRRRRPPRLRPCSPLSSRRVSSEPR